MGKNIINKNIDQNIDVWAIYTGWEDSLWLQSRGFITGYVK
jgi:hypothetical protein